MSFDDLLNHGQAKAGITQPSFCSGLVCLVEPVEDVLKMFRRYSDTIIGYAQDNAIFRAVQINHDKSIFFAVADAVADQVDQRTHYLCLVGIDFNTVIEFFDELDVFDFLVRVIFEN